MAPTVDSSKLRSKLTELGFKFKRETERVRLFRRPADMCRLSVNKKKTLDIATVTSILRQAGCEEDDILSFINHAQA